MQRPGTLGELRASGYRVVSVKEEMRHNLICKLRAGEPLFPGILGYDETVLPELQNAILARHDVLLLGLRGQAKTRLLRLLVGLLDDAIPVLAGSEINDNPFAPISRAARDRLAWDGDATPIAWVGPERRYLEKLATPDVTIADLIGEVDLIKHAEGHHLANELTMHYGLVPRANRGIFCINELPDLSPKVQVGLFNILEERDVQIRGYPVRLPLDVCMVFSANPEDYTNRGRIVTPLKDRIGSVIRTHYPRTRADGMAITDANAWLQRDGTLVFVPLYLKEVLEELARLARLSPAINQQSGVSARLSIANSETMVSNAERRGLVLGENPVVPRISDLVYLAASSRGKIELTLAEDDGQEDRVVEQLLGEAVKSVFAAHGDVKQLRPVVDWFESGRTFRVGDRVPSADYARQLEEVPALRREVERFVQTAACAGAPPGAAEALAASATEFLLEGLHVENKLSKTRKGADVDYKR
jgi:magnesium chelatase subunit I